MAAHMAAVMVPEAPLSATQAAEVMGIDQVFQSSISSPLRKVR